MSGDGTKLEILVRQIEEVLLPQGFAVTARSKVFNDEGVQVAEFDIEIKGRLGSTEIAWLIECRDRLDTAPASWIEQLVGRRDRFGFNKVTAVSTSGFAPGAVQYAQDAGIELRTVREVNAADVSSWLALRTLTVTNYRHNLTGVFLQYGKEETPARIEALRRTLARAAAAVGGKAGEARVLRAIDHGGIATPAEAFVSAVKQIGGMFDDVAPNSATKVVHIKVGYPNEASHFVVDTDEGPVRIREMRFNGELSIVQTEVPHGAVTEYRGEGEKKHIAQSVSFPLEHGGAPFEVEMHNLGDTGETIILLKKGGK